MPRDLSGDELVVRLRPLGFDVVWQSGSHIRLTAPRPSGEFHLTVPRHEAIRVGTLSGILSKVAAALGVDRDVPVADLFD